MNMIYEHWFSARSWLWFYFFRCQIKKKEKKRETHRILQEKKIVYKTSQKQTFILIYPHIFCGFYTDLWYTFK